MTEVPHYSYEDLRKKADDFLRTYNPSGAIPIPIEEIVEFEFNINIVPVLALQREFKVEGFTSSDLKTSMLTSMYTRTTSTVTGSHLPMKSDISFCTGICTERIGSLQ